MQTEGDIAKYWSPVVNTSVSQAV